MSVILTIKISWYFQTRIFKSTRMMPRIQRKKIPLYRRVLKIDLFQLVASVLLVQLTNLCSIFQLKVALNADKEVHLIQKAIFVFLSQKRLLHQWSHRNQLNHKSPLNLKSRLSHKSQPNPRSPQSHKNLLSLKSPLSLRNLQNPRNQRNLKNQPNHRNPLNQRSQLNLRNLLSHKSLR